MTRPAHARRPIEVVHLITGSGRHPYFDLFAAHSDHDRFHITVGSLEAPGRLQNDMRMLGLETFSLGADSPRDYPAAVLRLARRLSQSRAAVVQGHLLEASLVALAAARSTRAPLAVFTGHHSHEIPIQRDRRLLYAERACAGSLSDLIIAPSRDARDTIRRTTGVPEAKIELIHHGFELDRLDPAQAPGAELRASLGLQDRVVMCAIGRSYWIKNYAALITAFAPLARERPDLALLLVGAGHQPEAEQLAARLDIGDQVVVCGPRPDVADVLNASDVFVHPALAESFGMVLIEAMAMAKPVVSTPVGIAPEVVVTGETGVLLRGSDPSDLQQGLREILAMRERWPEIGSRARRVALEFPAEAMVRSYESAYLTRLEQRSRLRRRV